MLVPAFVLADPHADVETRAAAASTLVEAGQYCVFGRGFPIRLRISCTRAMQSSSRGPSVGATSSISSLSVSQQQTRRKSTKRSRSSTTFGCGEKGHVTHSVQRLARSRRASISSILMVAMASRLPSSVSQHWL